MTVLPQELRIDSIKNLYQHKNVHVDVLRSDLVHPVVSGNKWFKLRHYLQQALTQGATCLLTFGGAYSNHIVATAAMCQQQGLTSIGIIRGEKPAVLSYTLQDAAAFGMRLYFIPREQYRLKLIPDEVWSQQDQSATLVVAEGGYGSTGMQGAALLLSGSSMSAYSHFAAAVGTGTTVAGITTVAHPHQKVLGISALKNNVELEAAIKGLLPTTMHNRFLLHHQFHFGGYAKHHAQLLQFMNSWYDQTKIPSDFVYTGKLFYAIDSLIRDDYFKAGSRILIVHSGGLQGNRSLKKGTLIF